MDQRKLMDNANTITDMAKVSAMFTEGGRGGCKYYELNILACWYLALSTFGPV